MTLDLNLAIRKRRMYREFEDRPVDPADIATLLWAAGRAQQARPGVRHIVVVDDPGLMRSARIVLPGFALTNAPMMLVMCSDFSNPAVDWPVARDRSTWLDAGAACAHLGLIAQELGLGTCTIAAWTASAVRALFDIPGHLRPDVTVAIGHPVRATTTRKIGGAKYRPDVHHNSFGSPYNQELPR
jgi:nitroreductase